MGEPDINRGTTFAPDTATLYSFTATAQLPTVRIRLRFDDIAHQATTSFLEGTEQLLPN
jgi:hypothetical protein